MHGIKIINRNKTNHADIIFALIQIIKTIKQNLHNAKNIRYRFNAS